MVEVKRLRIQVAPTARSSSGRHAYALGLRVGYWPCLGGPFIQMAIATKRLDLWFGRPSYLGARRRVVITVRVLVTGGRDYADVGAVRATLYQVETGGAVPILIHGVARGADALARRVAVEELGWTEEPYPAQWEKWGKVGGLPTQPGNG